MYSSADMPAIAAGISINHDILKGLLRVTEETSESALASLLDREVSVDSLILSAPSTALSLSTAAAGSVVTADSAEAEFLLYLKWSS